MSKSFFINERFKVPEPEGRGTWSKNKGLDQHPKNRSYLNIHNLIAQAHNLNRGGVFRFLQLAKDPNLILMGKKVGRSSGSIISTYHFS